MYLVQLPIRPIDLSAAADVARHDRMGALVERMLDLQRKLAGASVLPGATSTAARSKPPTARSTPWCTSCTA